MALDLSGYVGEQRAGLIVAGRSYGSEAVQEAAELYANALKTHAGALYRFSYADKDGARLAELCVESKRLCEERPEVARDKSAARASLRAEVKAAKQERQDRRVTLETVLSADSDGLAAEVVRRARQVLADTASAGDDVDRLELQLLALAASYEVAELVPLLDARGGAGGAVALREQAKRLDEAQAAASLGRGTAEETALLDLIDGLMLERLRAIRKIARRASTRLGDPSIADAFSLAVLG
jgi:hypothetical protein